MCDYKNVRNAPFKNLTKIIALFICFILSAIYINQPVKANASENTTLHAFYPANAVYSDQIQKYMKSLNSISFAWGRFDASDSGTLNTVKGKNGNYDFYYPADYIQPITYAKSQGKSIQLSIYMSKDDYPALLPNADKQSAMIQSIVDFMQQDITQGNGLYFDGVVIDFEGLRDTDKNNNPILYDGKQISTYLTQFLTDLKAELAPMGKKLYVAVNVRESFNGYNYKGILKVADQVILMAHDYEPDKSVRLKKSEALQYTGFNTQMVNSLAPILKVKQALKDVQSAATNKSDLSKVWLQICFDSAQWKFNVNGVKGWEDLDDSTLSNSGKAVPTYNMIKALVDNTDGRGQNIAYGYNNELQSPYIQYYNTKDKTWNVILYEDSKSIAAKIDLARSYGLSGISVWSLGNVPDYNDSTGKAFHLNDWATIISKTSTSYTPSADSKKYVKFVDTGVEKAIRTKLDKPTGQISVADLNSIYRLQLTGSVKSLDDLKKLVNLEYLDARNLKIKNISAIGYLTNLRWLNLRQNQISDISSIQKLKHLIYLSLNYNQVVTIKPLAGLTQLQELYLSNNKIADVSALSKLSGVKILNLENNSISNIKALSGLVHLKELWLSKNKITKVAPMKGLLSLQKLYLSGNKITDYSTIKKIYLQPNFVCDFKKYK